MNLFPQSYDGWRKFYYFIFRAYVLLALPAVELFHSYNQGYQALRSYLSDAMVNILLGYIICFVVLLASSAQLCVRITKERIINLIFLIVTILFGAYLYHYYFYPWP